MSYPSIVILCIIILIYVLRPFTILLHELGHAIPMILLTRKKATIFVGSYGDVSKSFHFNIGLLEIYVKRNPLLFFKGGLCVPAATDIPINHQIIYVLSGPVSSLLLVSAASFAAFQFDTHGAVKFILVMFTCLVLVDLFMNLYPRTSSAIYHVDGSSFVSDGQLIINLLKYKKYVKTYQQAAAVYNSEEFDKAAVLLDKMISKGNKEPILFRLAIIAHHCIGNNAQALVYFKDLEERDTLIADDHVTIGCIKSTLDLEEESMEAYDQALLLDPSHPIALNNKGYTLLTQYKYEEALPYLEKAVIVAPDKGYVFNNLGLAKIKTGDMEDGRKNILHSLELDANNGYAYRNLGIYYLDKGNKEEALKQFEIAVQKEDDIPLIQALIEEAGGLPM